MVTPTRLSKILGPDGKPIEINVLSEEIAVPTEMGVRRVIEDQSPRQMSPEHLANVLLRASRGDAREYLTLAQEIEERYLHFGSQLQTRRFAIDGIDPNITTPEGVPAKIIDACKSLIEDNNFMDMRSDLSEGLSTGYSVVENIIEYEDGLLKPIQYKHRDCRFFVFDKLSLKELRLATNDNPRDGEELPAWKFICHLPKTKPGIPLRAGLARGAAWAYLIQNYSLKDWMSFCSIYGIPFRLGRYNSNASEGDKRSLLNAVRSIANDAAAIAPTGMEIEFHKTEGSHGDAVFGNLIDYVDKQVSKLVLGQTMTSDNGSSLAQAEIHNEVRIDILRADCRQLAQTLNRDLLEPFIAMNFGPQAVYPRIELPVSENEDTKTLTENVARLVPFGFRVSQKDIRERLSLPDPDEKDEILVANSNNTPPPSNLSATHGNGCQCSGCTSLAKLTTGNSIDEIERLANEELEEWEDITDPLFEPLRLVLTRATSLEEAREMIGNAEPDGGPLTQALSRMTAISRGIGDVVDDVSDVE